MKFVDLVYCNNEKKCGNHSLEIKSKGIKHLIYHWTCICKINDSCKVFATDRSWGSVSTSKACTQYERELLSRGYRQVEFNSNLLE